MTSSLRSRSRIPALALVLLVLGQIAIGWAGLASLNILQHQHLRKGRGIAEQDPTANLPSDKEVKGANSKERSQASQASHLPPPPRSMRLDIVITHFHPIRVQPALDFWLDFLESDKVRRWQPYVFVYCQNEEMTNSTELAPLLRGGGEVVHLKNVGRESHSYLQHIINHNQDLADYTLFSQDIPDYRLVERFERMFDNNTGFLPLSMLGHVDCNEDFLPAGQIPQLYAMLTHSFCPPEGYTGAFEGQFVVSRKRILDQDWWVYKNLLDLVSAPLDHWVHDMHDNQHFKDTTNPLLGHSIERAWSLMFHCYEWWRHGNCRWCDEDMHMEGCGTDACQCLDTIPEGMT